MTTNLQKDYIEVWCRCGLPSAGGKPDHACSICLGSGLRRKPIYRRLEKRSKNSEKE